jgi:hypothetical protein
MEINSQDPAMDFILVEITIKTWENETDIASAQNIFGAEEEKENPRQSLILPQLIDDDYFKF